MLFGQLWDQNPKVEVMRTAENHGEWTRNTKQSSGFNPMQKYSRPQQKPKPQSNRIISPSKYKQLQLHTKIDFVFGSVNIFDQTSERWRIQRKLRKWQTWDDFVVSGTVEGVFCWPTGFSFNDGPEWMWQRVIKCFPLTICNLLTFAVIEFSEWRPNKKFSNLSGLERQESFDFLHSGLRTTNNIQYSTFKHMTISSSDDSIPASFPGECWQLIFIPAGPSILFELVLFLRHDDIH
jgi:hypothetical protein